MSNFYAEFAMCGSPAVLVRKDTRAYFQSIAGRKHSDPARCLGVVWMCNPGSARAVGSKAVSAWGAVTPGPTLRTLLSVMRAATAGKTVIGEDDYIAVMNCFYVCDSSISQAFRKWRSSDVRYCEEIPAGAKFVLAAWGIDPPYGVVSLAMNRIMESQLPVIFHDPKAVPSTPTSFQLSTLWYPAHPGSKEFRANIASIASAIATHL